MESTRVDRWLWAVRLAKTRADAAAACRGGHVRVNDVPAKPATPVRPGDTVRSRAYGIPRIVEVSTVIEKRVGAPVAVECYVDHTPPTPPPSQRPAAPFVRERGSGRPTKRDRRRLDALRDVPILALDASEGPSLAHEGAHDPAHEADPEAGQSEAAQASATNVGDGEVHDTRAQRSSARPPGAPGSAHR